MIPLIKKYNDPVCIYSNHATFYVSQVIATKVLAGDIEGATAAAQDYFSHQFLDQVAASGEQPFEAVRTRPFHYRSFNLEAMIVRASMILFYTHAESAILSRQMPRLGTNLASTYGQ
jgi:hypothetical protein